MMCRIGKYILTSVTKRGGHLQIFGERQMSSDKRGGRPVRSGRWAALCKERRAMDNRHHRRHHCHPHHCAAIAIAVAEKPSLRHHRHRCAATFSAIAAPHCCAVIAALPPQLLRSHHLRHHYATTTSTPVCRAPVNDVSASRALVDDTNATIKSDE